MAGNAKTGSIAAALTLCITISAHAAETAAPAGPADESDGDNWTVSLGAGIAAAPDFEGSDDYTAKPLLFARAQRGPFFVSLEGTALRANVVPSTIVQAGPLIRYRFGRDDVENDAVDDLKDVDDAVEVGGFVALALDPFTLGAEATQDVADGHDGFQLRLGGDYATTFGERLAGTFGVFSTYADGNYNDSFFGVSGADSNRSGLDTFDAGAGFKDVGTQARLTYDFSERWSLSAIARYTRLIGDAEDSPIVDDEGSPDQFFAGIAVGYRFTIND